jgi:hypothetical protein
MEAQSYWAKVLEARTARRRILAGSVMLGASAAALSLVGCGGDDDRSLRREGSGLLATAEDTTGQAKRGGTLRDVINSDYQTFDPLSNNNNPLSNMSQSRLVMGVPTRFEYYDGKVQGDLAESWEVSGDGLQWTWKLRETPPSQSCRRQALRPLRRRANGPSILKTLSIPMTGTCHPVSTVWHYPISWVPPAQ